MNVVEGAFLNKKDKRGGLRISKNPKGETVVQLMTDLTSSGKYKIRHEGTVRAEGDQFKSDLRSPDGRVLPIDLKTTEEGLQVTFIYSAQSGSPEGLDAVDVVDYTKVPDDSLRTDSE